MTQTNRDLGAPARRRCRWGHEAWEPTRHRGGRTTECGPACGSRGVRRGFELGGPQAENMGGPGRRAGGWAVNGGAGVLMSLRARAPVR